MRLAKYDGGVVEYGATVVSDDGDHILVRATWAEADVRDLGFIRFEPGDVFAEHYWRDRWYSIKEVRTAAGALKGWYCDVARPVEVDTDSLVSADLFLDLWVSADGQTILRLDEDEFSASGLPDSDPAAAARAVSALGELERLAIGRFRTIVREFPTEERGQR